MKNWILLFNTNIDNYIGKNTQSLTKVKDGKYFAYDLHVMDT